MSAAQKGVTLIEVMLVLAIGAAILLLGFNQYQVYQRQQAAAKINYNVQMVLQAMRYYYQANCRDRYTSQGQPDLQQGKGALSPSQINPYPPTPTQYHSIDMEKDLRGNGFLPLGQPQDNAMISAYVLQFNPEVSSKAIYTCIVQGPLGPTACTPSVGEPIKKTDAVVIWRAQVAVLLKDLYDAETYQKVLGADCRSDMNKNIVYPCKAGVTGNYLVWERLPSFATTQQSSNMWSIMPVVKQFTQQYSNDDYYAYELNDPSWNTTSNYENYLCGG